MAKRVLLLPSARKPYKKGAKSAKPKSKFEPKTERRSESKRTNNIGQFNKILNSSQTDRFDGQLMSFRV